MINDNINELVMDSKDKWKEFINIGYGVFLEKSKTKRIENARSTYTLDKRFNWKNGAIWIMGDWGNIKYVKNENHPILKRKIDEGE